MKESIIETCVASFYVNDNGEAFRHWLKFSISQPTGTAKILVIMMNPGKSHPMILHSEFKTKIDDFNSKLASKLSNLGNIEQIECYRDNTQIKVAKWMQANGYKEALVVNLSNYCSEDSKEFYKKLRIQNGGGLFHSVFENREINSILKKHGTGIEDVLFAWGVNDNLNPSVKKVEGWLESTEFKFKKRFGHQKLNSPSKYYHPMKHGLILDVSGWNPTELKVK